MLRKLEAYLFDVLTKTQGKFIGTKLFPVMDFLTYHPWHIVYTIRRKLSRKKY